MDVSGSYVFIENNELFINVSPNNLLNNQIVKSNQIHSNRTYREYLQQNALEIQSSSFKLPEQVLGKTIPYTFSSAADTSKPKGYEHSVPKQQYLAEQFLVASQTRPMFDSIVFERA